MNYGDAKAYCEAVTNGVNTGRLLSDMDCTKSIKVKAILDVFGNDTGQCILYATQKYCGHCATAPVRNNPEFALFCVREGSIQFYGFIKKN